MDKCCCKDTANNVIKKERESCACGSCKCNKSTETNQHVDILK